jgi:hypothetical protein
LKNIAYKVKDFFVDHLNNIELFWIVGTIFGMWVQLFFLIKLNAIQFFSWNQTLNDFVIIFWYSIIMFVLFYVIYKIFKGKTAYKYVILIVILMLLWLHYFGIINHYVDNYLILFFSILAWILFFGEVLSLLNDLIKSIKWKKFKRWFFVIKIWFVSLLIFLYGYIYFSLFENADNIFFSIYNIDFQFKWIKYKSIYFNDKYIFTKEKDTNKLLIFPVTMIDYFSK